MAFLEFSLFFLFIFSLFPIGLSSGGPNCSVTFCGKNSVPIRFPFRVNPIQQPDDCGYPRITLSCLPIRGRDSQLILNLPNSGEFAVREIDYRAQTIWIDDPTWCLPKRILQTGIDVTGSPFSSIYNETYVFYNCSSSNHDESPTALCPDYVVMRKGTPPPGAGETCTVAREVTVPGEWNGLRSEVGLRWTPPVSCQCPDLPTGNPERNRFSLIIGIAMPALAILVFFTICCITSKRRSSERERERERNRNNSSATITGLGGLPITGLNGATIMGLDGPTIEKYPKTQIGEISFKLSNSKEDNTCLICLSEYEQKDVVRTVPECNHYFHVECIDPWLKIRGTCPVCRKSPDNLTRKTKTTPSSSSAYASSSSSLSLSSMSRSP